MNRKKLWKIMEFFYFLKTSSLQIQKYYSSCSFRCILHHQVQTAPHHSGHFVQINPAFYSDKRSGTLQTTAK